MKLDGTTTAGVNSTRNSDALDLGQSKIRSLSLASFYDGDLRGTTKLQASNDGDNWVDITDSEQTIDADDFTAMWNIEFAGYNYIREALTRTSGSADHTCTPRFFKTGGL